MGMFVARDGLLVEIESPGPTENGKGFCVRIARHGTLEILLNDGRSESAWACDPDLLKPGEAHHIGVVVDGGPKVITFTVDGALCETCEM